MIGYSEGGAAAAWAAQLQPSYAPEIPLCGVVAGAAAADVETAGPSLDGTFFSFFMAYGGIGYAAAYPELELDPYLTPLARGRIEMMRRSSVLQAALFGPRYIHATDLTQPNVLEMPDWRARLRENRLGTIAPAAPVLLHHARRDQIVSFEQSVQLREDWERLGADVRLYVTRGGVDHISGALAGTPVALEWLARRLGRAQAQPPVASVVQDTGDDPRAGRLTRRADRSGTYSSGRASQPSRRPSRTSSRHGRGGAGAGDEREQLAEPARRPQILRPQPALAEERQRRSGPLERSVADRLHRRAVEPNRLLAGERAECVPGELDRGPGSLAPEQAERLERRRQRRRDRRRRTPRRAARRARSARRSRGPWRRNRRSRCRPSSSTSTSRSWRSACTVPQRAAPRANSTSSAAAAVALGRPARPPAASRRPIR